MTHFNVTHYFMWIIIGVVPMAMFYFTTHDLNLIVKVIVGFSILEFVLLFVAPRIEMRPIGDLYWEDD